MANFLQLPVASSLNISNIDTGAPFTDNAINVGGSVSQGGVYAATDTGTVYAANVNGKLAFVCIGMGYKGYTWISRATITTSWEVQSTEWNTIYAIETPYPANTMGTTIFPTFDAMTEMFYNEFVSPDFNGVVVTVIGAKQVNDPMDAGGTSGLQDPTGDFDDSSDPIGEPIIPTIGAQNSGMISLFRPSLEQVQSLGQYIWTHIDDFIANLQKWLTDPSGYIISFHIVPCVPSVGTVRNINIGNVVTTIEMPPCVSQWYTFDFGAVQISPYSGTYLDYAPYTKIQLFLPYIGSVQLNTDEVMNTTLGIKYRIDLLSGQCVALISVNGSYLYQYTGECSVPIPLTGNDWSRVYAAAVGAVGAFATGATSISSSGNAVRTASNSAMRTSSSSVETLRKSTKSPASVREIAAENARLALENARNASRAEVLGAQQVKASKIANTIASTVSSVMGAKQYVAHSGSVTGSAGMLGIKKPFVIIEYPNQSLAENYKRFVGYPSNISGKLSDFTGYTECEQVIPNSFSGTDDELAQVLELLKEGVYL